MIDLALLVRTVKREQATDGSLVYVARYPELTGAMAQGATIDEATANLDEVARGILDHIRQHGLAVQLVYRPMTPDRWVAICE